MHLFACNGALLLQKCSACCASVFEGRCVFGEDSQTRAFHCLFACALAVLTRSLAGRLANASCCYLALLYAKVQAPRPWDKTRAPVTLADPCEKARRVNCYSPLIAIGRVVPGPPWQAHLAAHWLSFNATARCARGPLTAQDSAFYKAPLRLAKSKRFDAVTHR